MLTYARCEGVLLLVDDLEIHTHAMRRYIIPPLDCLANSSLDLVAHNALALVKKLQQHMLT